MGKKDKKRQKCGRLASVVPPETGADTQSDDDVQVEPPAWQVKQTRAIRMFSHTRTNLLPSLSPYFSAIVSAVVGKPPKEFNLHLGVLSQSPFLCSKVKTGYGQSTLQLPEVDPAVFELVLCYLYGGNYKEYQSCSNLYPKKANIPAATLNRHALLYCFALKYQMDQLAAMTMENIIFSSPISYKKFLSIAKGIYKELPDEELSFRNFFMEETRKASAKNLNLGRESWVLDALKEGGGNLAVDLFTTFVTSFQNSDFKSHVSEDEAKTIDEPILGDDHKSDEVSDSDNRTFYERESIEVISADEAEVVK